MEKKKKRDLRNMMRIKERINTTGASNIISHTCLSSNHYQHEPYQQYFSHLQQ